MAARRAENRRKPDRGGDTPSFTELTSDGFDRTIALLTRSVTFDHKFTARQFIEQGGGGAIVTTASGAALQGGWAPTGYTIAKHAIVGVVCQAVAELAPRQIRSNALAPGVILTPSIGIPYGVPPDRAMEFANFIDQQIGHTQPIGRFGRPADVAKVAAFLASDMSSFMNAAVVPVDGGAGATNPGSPFADVRKAAQDFIAA